MLISLTERGREVVDEVVARQVEREREPGEDWLWCVVDRRVVEPSG